MSAAPVVESLAVTPVRTRKRVREQHVRGPVARPQRLGAPGGRPAQPLGPVLAGGPVRLRRGVAGGRHVRAGVRLTDRGIAVVVVLLAAIAVATVGVGVSRFLAVSNAPVDDAPATRTASVQTVLVPASSDGR